MNYVIVGNGAAAVGAIEGIRSIDSDGSITVISKEPCHVYSRPLISYLLQGKTDKKRMLYRPESFYDDNGVKVLYGKNAVRLDTKSKTVNLDSGEEIKYDKLLIAAGSSPFVPTIKGLGSVKHLHSFMTLADAEALEKDLSPDARVLIVGAGLIGLKCAEGILERVLKVTVCDLAPRVLSSILDGECAAIVQKKLEEHGIEFLLDDTPARFEGDRAVMRSGKEVEFDILVTAVGVRANIGLVKDAGGECGRGISVTDTMRTSIPDVFAAGDCTESVDSTSGEKKVMAIMPLAYIQGHCGGVNMAGGLESIQNAMPMNSIGFFGLHCMSAGTYVGECFEEKFEGGIKRLYTKDNLLKGFILIGKTDRAGIYTAMIRNRTPLSDVDFEMLKKSPGLAPFGKEYRISKLGGAV